MSCREINELLEGYAAGALTDAERRRVDEYLDAYVDGSLDESLDADCEDCRQALAELTVCAAALAAAEEPVAPPPSLKAGLMARVDAEPLPAANRRPSPPAETGRGAWRSYLGIAIAASLVGVLAARLTRDDPAPVNQPTVAQAQAELDAYRQRIAETDRVLGLSRTRLVRLDANPLGAELPPRLIYDEVSGQLHVLAPTGLLRGKAEAGWAWIVGRDGEPLAGGRLAPVGDAYSGAALDLPGGLADAARLLFTLEDSDAPQSPSDALLGEAPLIVSE